jgi:hypothetical protein
MEFDKATKALGLTDEIVIGQSQSGRDVIVRYEEGSYSVIVGDELSETFRRNGLWPRSKAMRFAKVIANDKYY